MPALTRRGLFAAATGSLAVAAAADDPPPALPRAKPEELGIDPQRLQVAYDLLAKWTAGPNAPVPGGAILVGRHGKAVAARLFGRQGPEPDAGPIRPDALFYLASVTKPVLFLAAMRLVERGQLNLSDPVSRYVPEFAGGGKEEARVVHLFTHTSGLPDDLPDNAELRRQHAPMTDFVRESIRTDLLFKPGTQLSYSSAATFVLAEIAQRLTGRPVREFVHREVIEPLGLKNLGLGVQGFAPERLVRCQVPDYQTDGRRWDWNSPYWRAFGSPTGGMYGSVEDVAAVLALMLGGGKLNGVRLISSAASRAMTENRLDDFPDLPEPVRRTRPWGLGWRLNHPGTADSWGDLLDRRVFGHTGSSGNLVWADPRTGGFCVLLTNALRARAPWRLVHLSNAVAAAFE